MDVVPGNPIHNKCSRVDKIVESPRVDGSLPRTIARRNCRMVELEYLIIIIF